MITKPYEFTITGPEDDDESYGFDEERWAVQAFCEEVGHFLTLAKILPGTMFRVRQVSHDNVIISYTVK